MTLFEIHKALAKIIGEEYIDKEKIHPMDMYKILQALSADCLSLAVGRYKDESTPDS